MDESEDPRGAQESLQGPADTSDGSPNTARHPAGGDHLGGCAAVDEDDPESHIIRGVD